MLGSHLKKQPAFGYHQAMCRAVLILLTVFMVSFGAGVSAATKLSCTLLPYKYRGPIISGCEFHVTSTGITEYFTTNDGQVFTGMPTFSQRELNASSQSRKSCPTTVVREIDNSLSSEGLTWATLKSSMQAFFLDLSATDVSKLTMSSAMDGTGGALSIGGDFFQIDKFKKDEFGFFWTTLDDGSQITVSVAKNVELTMAGDWGAFDYRGTCQKF